MGLIKYTDLPGYGILHRSNLCSDQRVKSMHALKGESIPIVSVGGGGKGV